MRRKDLLHFDAMEIASEARDRVRRIRPDDPRASLERSLMADRLHHAADLESEAARMADTQLEAAVLRESVTDLRAEARQLLEDPHAD